MNVSILTIFPELFDSFWNSGIVKKAIKLDRLIYSIYSVRSFVEGKHKNIDDRPFGGGCGMIMKARPLVSAIKAAKKNAPNSNTILLSPQGKKLNHKLVSQLASLDELIFICGRYEGVDERVIDGYVDFEVSIGDYVLTGGELAAMVVIDALIRLIPGVLGNPNSAKKDTFSNGLIEHAHYTRPRLFEGRSVPNVLLSGHHDALNHWKLETSLMRTLLKRKDLLKNKDLSLTEIEILDNWRLNIEQIIQK